MKRWSKLRREIRRFFPHGLDLDIHCVAYPIDSNYGHDKKIPRFWLTLGKEIIWDWPALPPHNFDQFWIYPERIYAIPIAIRAHIDSSLEEDIAVWLSMPETNDWDDDTQPPPSLIEILICADRRLGKRRAALLLPQLATPAARKVLLSRWPELGERTIQEPRKNEDIRAWLMPLTPRGRIQFEEWLAAVPDRPGGPRIAWYPGAGLDFRDLIYLHPNYLERRGFDLSETPDLFLHTDYYPWSRDAFLNQKAEKGCSRTQIRILRMSEMTTAVDLAEHNYHLVDFHPIRFAGRTLLLDLEIASEGLGTFRKTMLYSLAETAQFFCEVILPRRMRISHLISHEGSPSKEGLPAGAARLREHEVRRVAHAWLRGFLGLMGTRYTLLDRRRADCKGPFPAPLRKFDELRGGTLAAARRSPDNRPVALREIGAIAWEGLGQEVVVCETIQR